MVQPQQAAGVDWLHPLSKGLLTLGTVAGDTPIDVLNSVSLKPSGGTCSIATRSRGLATAVGSGINDVWTATLPAKPTSGITAHSTFCLAYSDGSTSVRKRAMRLGSSVSGTVMALDFHDGVNNFVGASYQVTGATFPGLGSTSNPQPGVVYSVGFSRSGTTQTMVLNGTQEAGASTTSSNGLIADVNQLAISNNSAGALPFVGGVFIWAAWSRALSVAELRTLHQNPWQLFAPAPARLWAATIPAVTITRPGSDITVSGWTATPGGSLFDAINEAGTPDDADYITSPDLSTPATFGLTAPIPAGTYTVRLRAQRNVSTGQARVALLDSGGTQVGVTAWQALTTTLTTWSLSVTTTGTAAQARIEVQA